MTKEQLYLKRIEQLRLEITRIRYAEDSIDSHGRQMKIWCDRILEKDDYLAATTVTED